jgi:hypothetical protein
LTASARAWLSDRLPAREPALSVWPMTATLTPLILFSAAVIPSSTAMPVGVSVALPDSNSMMRSASAVSSTACCDTCTRKPVLTV